MRGRAKLELLVDEVPALDENDGETKSGVGLDLLGVAEDHVHARNVVGVSNATLGEVVLDIALSEVEPGDLLEAGHVGVGFALVEEPVEEVDLMAEICHGGGELEDDRHTTDGVPVRRSDEGEAQTVERTRVAQHGTDLDLDPWRTSPCGTSSSTFRRPRERRCATGCGATSPSPRSIRTETTGGTRVTQ